MASATEEWIGRDLVTGKSVLKVAASMGEGPQLGESEWATLIHTVTRTAKGRVPVMAGIHCKDTVRTIDDIKSFRYGTYWCPSFASDL